MNKRTKEAFLSSLNSIDTRNCTHAPEFRKFVAPPPPIPKEKLTKMLGTEIPDINYDINYESPINIIYDNMRMQTENDIYKVVQSYEIKVDKDELIKALNYDRQQYQKGFRDGARKFAEELNIIMRDRYLFEDKRYSMFVTPEDIENCLKEIVGEG